MSAYQYHTFINKDCNEKYYKKSIWDFFPKGLISCNYCAIKIFPN